MHGGWHLLVLKTLSVLRVLSVCKSQKRNIFYVSIRYSRYFIIEIKEFCVRVREQATTVGWTEACICQVSSKASSFLPSCILINQGFILYPVWIYLFVSLLLSYASNFIWKSISTYITLLECREYILFVYINYTTLSILFYFPFWKWKLYCFLFKWY